MNKAREIAATVDIMATPESVWRALTNFADYPGWNPYIRKVQTGKLAAGAKLLMAMCVPPGRRARIVSSIVTKAIPASELRWRRNMFGGLFRTEHSFVIVPQGVEGSRLIHRKRFYGLLAPLLFGGLEANLRKSFEEMNRALKRVAER